MSEEKLWINVRRDNGESFDPVEMQEFAEEMQEFFREKDVMVSVGDMETISAEEVQGIAEILRETIG
jgi:uncharacterized protein YfkK (UPF0435 family)